MPIIRVVILQSVLLAFWVIHASWAADGLSPLILLPLHEGRDAYRPAAGAGAGIFLVVWQDLRKGKDYDVYGVRVTPEGTLLDPEGIVVCAEKGNQANPQVTWEGKSFVVV